MPRVLPAEWAPQDALLLIWPHADSDWAARREVAEAAFGALALAVCRFEPLVIACHDQVTRRRAIEHMQDLGCPRAAFTTALAPSDDTWARDIAPITVFDDEHPLCIDFAFDGWGGKYRSERDAAFAGNLLDNPGFATLGREHGDFVLEGGAIETDGAGTLLVNRRTVLDPVRNRELDREDAEARFRRHFGIERMLWLDVEPVPGDDTDGHIDTLARFTDIDTIVHATPHSADDPAAATLATLHEQLTELRTADGRPCELVPLPNPAPFTDERGFPCPATYANFVIVNDAVLVPAYADANDGVAVERLQERFPGRTIVPVPSRTFVTQAGGPHCLTMHFPQGTLQDLALM